MLREIYQRPFDENSQSEYQEANNFLYAFKLAIEIMYSLGADPPKIEFFYHLEVADLPEILLKYQIFQQQTQK